MHIHVNYDWVSNACRPHASTSQLVRIVFVIIIAVIGISVIIYMYMGAECVINKYCV